MLAALQWLVQDWILLASVTHARVRCAVLFHALLASTGLVFHVMHNTEPTQKNKVIYRSIVNATPNSSECVSFKATFLFEVL